MRTNKTKIIALAIILFCKCNSSIAQSDSIRIIELERKVTSLEQYKENIESVSKIEYQKAKEELKSSFDKDYKDVKNILLIILGIGIPSTVYGIYMMFFGFNKKIKKKIEEKIETIVEHKREDIIKLINAQALDNKLKESKTILVISPNELSQNIIKIVMSKMKFKKILFRVIGTYQTLPEHDLIVFNNGEGDLLQSDINNIIEVNNDDDWCFVAYTSKPLERNPRMNFANSKFTLYHNILTTLSYSESINNN